MFGMIYNWAIFEESDFGVKYYFSLIIYQTMVTANVLKGVEVIYNKNSCFSKEERARYLRWQQRPLAA